MLNVKNVSAERVGHQEFQTVAAAQNALAANVRFRLKLVRSSLRVKWRSTHCGEWRPNSTLSTAVYLPSWMMGLQSELCHIFRKFILFRTWRFRHLKPGSSVQATDWTDLRERHLSLLQLTGPIIFKTLGCPGPGGRGPRRIYADDAYRVAWLPMSCFSWLQYNSCVDLILTCTACTRPAHPSSVTSIILWRRFTFPSHTSPGLYTQRVGHSSAVDRRQKKVASDPTSLTH